MKIKTAVAGIIIAGGMVLAAAPLQAAVCSTCYSYPPGWHMVAKDCNIPTAVTWQQYASGVYLAPAPQGGLLNVGNY